MLAWLFALACLASAAAEAKAEAALDVDVLPAIFSKLGFADLCQAFRVSQNFSQLAGQAIKAFYCMRCSGKIF